MSANAYSKRILLMIPGPSEPEPEVIASLNLPTVPHYGEQWKVIYGDMISKLQKVFKTTRNEVIALPSPGQSAVEMAVVNLVRKGGKAFVCSNGIFSEMIKEMIEYCGGSAISISADYGKAVTADDVRSVLDEHRDLEDKCLFIVHNETSTGVANPGSEILKICSEKGMISVFDAISSFGAMDVRVDEWKIDYCIGYPSKGIGGVFGVTPISISPRCWDIAAKNRSEIYSRFLNLNVWRYYIDIWGAWGHAHPSTMPELIVVALSRALDLVLEEGIQTRFERHARVAKMMRAGLESIGLKIFPDSGYLSDTVTVSEIEPKKDEKIREMLLNDYGVMISGGLGNLRGKVIRIGHMGTSATPEAVSLTCSALESVIGKLNSS